MRKLLVYAAGIISLAYVACSGPSNYSVEYPSIGGATNSALDITRIDVTDSSTVLHFNAYNRPGWWIKIDSATYIVAGNDSLQVCATEGITLNEKLRMNSEGTESFSLTFPALPAGTRTIDFVENIDEGFQLWDIELQGGGDGYPEGLPKAMRHTPKDGPLPEPVLSCDSATINISILNYRPEFGKTLSMQAFNMATYDELPAVKLDEQGRATLNLLLAGNTSFLLLNDKVGVGSFTAAPGETTDVYIDARILGDRLLYHRPDSVKKSHQRLFTNGKYADLNGNLAKQRIPYRIEFYSQPVGRYDMTGDEYTAEALKLYNQLSDSIDAWNGPQMIKELNRAVLAGDLMAVINNAAYCGRISFYNAHPDWKERMPFDSIKTVITPENIVTVINSADFNNQALKIATDALVSAVPLSRDYTQYGDKAAQLQQLATLRRAAKSAKENNLTDSQLEELGKMDSPFYADAAKAIQANTLAAIESAKKIITPTPEVADEEVFDAIVAPHKGKVVLVDLWNTWCGPCRAAIKQNEPNKTGELSSPDIVWIYIADESSPFDAYANMIPDIKGMHYRLNAEQKAAISKRFNVDGIPFYIVVDRQGNVAGRPDLRDHSLFKKVLLEEVAKQ